jgi:hypothetical protein
MFLDKWIPKKYLVKSEICALEVLFQENSIVYYYTILKDKSKKLEITESGLLNDKLELPKQVQKNKIPIVIIINGKGVIIKKIDLSETEELPIEFIIKQHLPTINPEDFYIQLFKQSPSSAFLSICRKEQVNALVDEVKKGKYEIANIYIGVPAIIGLQPIWSGLNQVPVSTHAIELTNGLIESIQAPKVENDKIKIDSLELTKSHTLGFAGGLSYLMRNGIAQNANTELDQIFINHQEKNKFRFLTLVSVAIAFIIAVTNVLFYTNYFDTNNKLETELSVYQGKYEQINKLLSDYQSKKGLIENAGILNKNKLSEFADRIGATIPEEVILSNMYFNPKKEDIESEDSLVTFENKQLVIKGNCNKSLILNEWVSVLKMQKFIKDVSLEKFTFNKETALPNFEIRIITE